MPIIRPDMRNNLVATARWFAANKRVDGKNLNIHYSQDQNLRMAYEHLGKLVWPISTDCSGFFTMMYYINGCKDPNGANYAGWGYTGTLITNGKEIPMSKVQPGDAVIYGGGNGDHVAMIVEVHGKNIVTISHGQEGDPSYVWVNTPTGVILPQNAALKVVDGRQPQRFFTYDTKQYRKTIAMPPGKA